MAFHSEILTTHNCNVRTERRNFGRFCITAKKAPINFVMSVSPRPHWMNLCENWHWRFIKICREIPVLVKIWQRIECCLRM